MDALGADMQVLLVLMLPGDAVTEAPPHIQSVIVGQTAVLAKKADDVIVERATMIRGPPGTSDLHCLLNEGSEMFS